MSDDIEIDDADDGEISEDRGEMFTVSAEQGPVSAQEARHLKNAHKFRLHYVTQVQKLAARGFTDAEMAEFFEISVVTLQKWRAYNTAFRKASKIGKDAFDDRVESALGMRAVGFEKRSEKVFNEKGKIIRVDTVDYYPPDVKAAQIWLNNRRPDKWRERKEITGANGAPLHPENRPRLSKTETARRVMYVLQRGMDEQDQTPQIAGPDGIRDDDRIMKIVEERITETTEE